MKLHDVLKETFNAKDSEIADEFKISGFAQWDSLTHMIFITRLEEVYSMELDGDEIANMETVGDIKKILDSKGKLD